MAQDFGSNTLNGIAGILRGAAPVRVRYAWGGRRATRAGYLALDGDTLRLVSAAQTGLDLRVPRAAIEAARRHGPHRLELSVKGDPAQADAHRLRAIECDDHTVIDRVLAWLPDRVAAMNLVEHWYDVNLGPYRQRAYATYALAAVLVLAFAAQVLATGHWRFDPRELADLGANLPVRTLSGQPWRLFTALFLHADLGHLIGNLIVILVLSPYVERLYRPMGLITVFLGAGLAGSVIDLWTNFTSSAVGASGGVFGLLGALLIYAAWRRAQLPLRAIRTILLVGGAYLCWQMWEGFRSVVVNNSAHAAGFTAGLILGAIVAPPLQRTQEGRWAARAYGVLLAFVVASWVALPVTRKWSDNWQLVRTLDEVRQQVGEIDSRCQTAVAAARIDPAGSSIDFASACVVPLGGVLAQLRALRPEDIDLRLEVGDRVARLDRQYRDNTQLARTLADLAAITRAERTREQALNECDAVLEGAANVPAAQQADALDRDCLPRLDSALALLKQAQTVTPDYVAYARAASTLWQAERDGFAALAPALRARNSDGIERAVAAIEQAREQFATATGRDADTSPDSDAPADPPAPAAAPTSTLTGG
jgi:membrane associated rhomboid family serine protease